MAITPDHTVTDYSRSARRAEADARHRADCQLSSSPALQLSSFRGDPAIPAEEVNRKIALCYETNWQFLAHCNGDAVGDMMLDAVKDAREKSGSGIDRRDVVIHCQTVREDQLDAMKKYGLAFEMAAERADSLGLPELE